MYGNLPIRMAISVVSALFGILMASGALLVVLVIAMAVVGASPAQFFSAIPARFDGSPALVPVLVLGHALFFVYILFCVACSLSTRRALTNRWLATFPDESPRLVA